MVCCVMFVVSWFLGCCLLRDVCCLLIILCCLLLFIAFLLLYGLHCCLLLLDASGLNALLDVRCLMSAVCYVALFVAVCGSLFVVVACC